MSKSVLLMFSSRSFTVSSSTFRSLIYLELIFIHGVKESSNFILSHEAVQFSQHPLLKGPFFHCIFLPPLLQITDPNCVGFLLGFLSYSLVHVHLDCTCTVLYCFDYHSFVIQSEVREHDSSSSPFPFSRLFWLFQVFCVSKEIVKFFILGQRKMPLVI